MVEWCSWSNVAEPRSINRTAELRTLRYCTLLIILWTPAYQRKSFDDFNWLYEALPQYINQSNCLPRNNIAVTLFHLLPPASTRVLFSVVRVDEKDVLRLQIRMRQFVVMQKLQKRNSTAAILRSSLFREIYFHTNVLSQFNRNVLTFTLEQSWYAMCRAWSIGYDW